MSDQHLALLLDAPLQCWGFSSRFQRRTTGLHPTKSGLVGLICAAMGLAKGSPTEAKVLPQLTALKLTTIVLPRQQPSLRSHSESERVLPVLRLEDYHTVQNTRRASGTRNTDAVITYRQFLMDARFGVILSGDAEMLLSVAKALQDPRWGIWFGRKCCIPAEPIYRGGPFASQAEALRALSIQEPLENFTRIQEVSSFDQGTDTWSDQPVSFQARQFAPRRIELTVGRKEQNPPGT